MASRRSLRAPALATAALAAAAAVLLPASTALLPAPLQSDAGAAGDAGDTFGSPRALPGTGTYDGELAYPLDYDDFYSMTLTVGGNVWAKLSNGDGAVLEILDPSGLSVATTGTVLTPDVYTEAPVTAGGSWRIHVHVGLSAETPYSFTWGTSSNVTVTADPVVVATLDTGTNPFHPCFRRPGLNDPSTLVPGYPASSTTLDLTFGSTYAASASSSATEIASIAASTLYHINNTNLIFYGGSGAAGHLVDDHPHGSQASSQIACSQFGLAPNALLVILNFFDSAPTEQYGLITWAANQAWIDIIHVNIAELAPTLVLGVPEIQYAVGKGKLVVVAGGNGAGNVGGSYPTELSAFSGPPGTLVAGANDNGGWASFSNLDPHVVMDGDETLAAAVDSFGATTFGGTSSASPRLAGYAARLLGEARATWDHNGTGLLSISASDPKPASGPLADGVLTAAELHETIRKTADPDPHDSRYDGGSNIWWMPVPVAAADSLYAKMGYGEVSEHTLPDAIDVLDGNLAMPSRPTEDTFYGISETARATFW